MNISARQLKTVQRHIDLYVGRSFDRLTIVSIYSSYDNNGRQRTYATCSCICGTTDKKIELMAVVNNIVRSCGCYKREVDIARKLKHGLQKHTAYSKWVSMMHRCYDKNDKGYHRYGGRGISVCSEWHTVDIFCNWYDSVFLGVDSSLDRIDVNGNYEPSNCRLASPAIQARNRRNNIKYKGETASEASRRLSLGIGVVAQRVRTGWSLKDAFTLNKQTYAKRTRTK